MDLVSHLARAAIKLRAAGSQGISRNLAVASRNEASRTGAPVPGILANCCPHCGAILAPGETSRVRITPIRRRRRRNRYSDGGLESKNRISITCLLCSERTVLPGTESTKRTTKKKRVREGARPAEIVCQPKKKVKPGSLSSDGSGFISLSEPKRKRKNKAKPSTPVARAPAASHFQSFLHSR